VDRVEKHFVTLRVGKRGHFRRRAVLVEGQFGVVVDACRAISRSLIERHSIHPFKELLIAVQDSVDHLQAVTTSEVSLGLEARVEFEVERRRFPSHDVGFLSPYAIRIAQFSAITSTSDFRRPVIPIIGI